MKTVDIDLFDLDLPIDGFSFGKYYEHEALILNPALTAAGYVLLGHWFTGESDSFGPLSRGIAARDPEGTRVTIWYG